MSVCGDTSPSPPDGVELPSGYKAKRCIWCKCWSTSPSPWSLVDTVLKSWHPLIPWGRGCRAKPISDECKVCVIVPRLDNYINYVVWVLYVVFCSFLYVFVCLKDTILNIFAVVVYQVWVQGGFEAEWQTKDRFRKAVQANGALLHPFIVSLNECISFLMF